MAEDRLTGRIVKGIGGFYYVYAEDGKQYETRARGLFRKDKLKPLVGDRCEIEVTDSLKQTGSVVTILPRQSELIRPAVANTDQAVVIFAVSRPEPHVGLMDRYLTVMAWQDMPVIIVLNKMDQDEGRAAELEEIYRNAGYRVVKTSVKTGLGLEEIRECLSGRTSVLSGPSGVGKSSLLNALYPEYPVNTGEISERIGRGKHTTRHSELMAVGQNTYILDTPGFTSVELPEEITEENIELCFPEFEISLGKCRFATCRHLSEPDCAVKAAVEAGVIEKTRYQSYREMQEMLRARRKY